MAEGLSTADRAPPNRTWWWESPLIVLLCYLKAGWPPPDVNEAHYLCKAKHYWNPDWCANDFFLNSADAHTPFYVLFGWVTMFVSLPAAAWIGRLVTWALIATAWQRLSWRLAPVPFAAVISGGLMIVLTTVGHMAGEWIIGGVEAKGFAFALVFLALEQLVRGRWNVMFVLLGGAAALHVLVGGWSVVAAGIAWLAMRGDRPPLLKILPGLAGGFALSLFGLVPVLLLNYGVDAETVQAANRIYVFERLPHHLVFNQFPHLWMARHGALALLFFVLVMHLRRTAPCSVQSEEGRSMASSHGRLAGFVGGAVAIAVLGIVIDQSTLHHDQIAARLLRFYWFRLSDVMVPCGVALLLPALVATWRQTRPQLAQSGWIALWLGVCLPLLAWNYVRQQHPLPGSALQSWQQQDEPTSLAEAEAKLADWQAVCKWINENTPRDAVFLTPKEQQTFKWYAGRAEVVALKDIPQDARGIVEWRQRVNDVFTPPVARFGYAALSDEQIVALANRYGARFVVVDRFPRLPRLRRVYPNSEEGNESFAVYQVPSADDRR